MKSENLQFFVNMSLRFLFPLFLSGGYFTTSMVKSPQALLAREHEAGLIVHILSLSHQLKGESGDLCLNHSAVSIRLCQVAMFPLGVGHKPVVPDELLLLPWPPPPDETPLLLDDVVDELEDEELLAPLELLEDEEELPEGMLDEDEDDPVGGTLEDEEELPPPGTLDELLLPPG